MEPGSSTTRILVPFLIVCLALAVNLYEGYRAVTIYEYCKKDHAVYANFTSNAVCTSHPLMQVFEMFGLTNCTKATKYVTTDPPLVCMARNWFQTFWIVELVMKASHRAELALDSWKLAVMAFIIVPVAVGILGCFFLHEKGETDRMQLKLQQQSLTMEAQQQNLTTIMALAKQPPPPPLSLQYHRTLQMHPEDDEESSVDAEVWKNTVKSTATRLARTKK